MPSMVPIRPDPVMSTSGSPPQTVVNVATLSQESESVSELFFMIDLGRE